MLHLKMNTAIPPTIAGSSSTKTSEISTLKVEDDIMLDGDMNANGDITLTTGTVIFSSAKAGSVTLASGTATVSTNVVLETGDRIFLTRRTTGAGAFGTPIIAAMTLGVAGVAAFTITSKLPADGTTTVTTDVGKIDWVVLNSAAFSALL